jgi:hypothetical protein
MNLVGISVKGCYHEIGDGCLWLGKRRRVRSCGCRLIRSAPNRMLKNSFTPRLLKKVQMQGGTRCETRGVPSPYAAAPREHANAADGPLSAACYSSIRPGGRLARFACPRRRFASSRRVLEAADGLVGWRALGLPAACRSNCTNRSSASWRFAPWVRKRLASMLNTPSLPTLRPARLLTRARTSSGKEEQARISNRRRTAVDTLLTFCPPGPEARTKSK